MFYGRTWFLILSILLTPYLLNGLGNDDYGIWVLIGAFVSFIALLDLGFGTSFVKHVAEFDARGDREGVSGVMTTGLVFYAVVALVILAITFPATHYILEFLNVSDEVWEKTRFVLQVGIIASLCANFLMPFQSIINGLQRMSISNGITVFMSICYFVGCIIAIEFNFGIQGVAVAQLITQIIGIAVSVFFAYRLCSNLRINLRSAKRHFFTLFRYGLNLLISNIAMAINLQFDKLLINRFINVTHVAIYDIAARVPISARTLTMVLLSALTPATSELEVRQGRDELYELFSKSAKYVSVMALPLFVGLFITSQPIIEAWIGKGYDASVFMMRVLCVGYFINILSSAVTPLVQGMGMPHYQRNAETLSVILNIILSVILVIRYGFYGAAMGTAVAMSISSVYYLWSFHRLMDRPFLPFLRSTYLIPAICAVASGVPAFVLNSILLPYASEGRLSSLITFLVTGALFAVSYIFLIYKCHYLNTSEISLFRYYLSFLWLRRP